MVLANIDKGKKEKLADVLSILEAKELEPAIHGLRTGIYTGDSFRVIAGLKRRDLIQSVEMPVEEFSILIGFWGDAFQIKMDSPFTSNDVYDLYQHTAAPVKEQPCAEAGDFDSVINSITKALAEKAVRNAMFVSVNKKMLGKEIVQWTMEKC